MSNCSVMCILLLITAVVLNTITLTVETRYKQRYQVHEPETGWNTAVFAKYCKNEPQPMVEYYNLNGTQYLFFAQRLTWDEARVLCINYNAKLAILDTMEKATSVAESIANSNIEMEEDSWLGGRRVGNTWLWIYDQVELWKNIEIPMESNIENYPPWSREPSRPMKECLAIDRRAHSHPNFIDLDCRLQRPFICEKQSEESVRKPVPSKWVQIQRHTYTFYHARITWEEAAVYCRLLGTRLAIIKDTNIIEILVNGMMKARPDFETVWIGAHYSYGQWVWMSTGMSLSSITENSYPPWRFGRSERNDGCLLLDRHTNNTPSFIEAKCDRKRDFVCEEYPEDETDNWLNEPIKFTHDNSTYVIWPMEKTWKESGAFCNERGSVLAYMKDINATNMIVEAMGDHPKDITHVWVGGYLVKPDEWQWTQNGHRIARKKDSTGFPPWVNTDEQFDRHVGTSTCLNLDRSDHVKPHFYGLDCSVRQPFVCKITCDVTPFVTSGNWVCKDTQDGKNCELYCDEGFIAMGIKNVSCTYQDGWATVKNWLEVPLCLVSRDYTRRMVRSLDHDLQTSAGYYFILDHANERVRSLALRFVERVLNIFPTNYNLKMGMYCMATNPPAQLPFNQTDTCAILQKINALANNSNASISDHRQIPFNTLYKHFSMQRGRKIVIFAIVDAKSISRYLEVLAHMKTIGNRVVAIGLEDDWEILLALASIGFDRRKNLYLFNTTEFDIIINEMHGFKKRTLKCSTKQTNIIDVYPPANKESTNSALYGQDLGKISFDQPEDIKLQPIIYDTTISSAVTNQPTDTSLQKQVPGEDENLQ